MWNVVVVVGTMWNVVVVVVSTMWNVVVVVSTM